MHRNEALTVKIHGAGRMSKASPGRPIREDESVTRGTIRASTSRQVFWLGTLAGRLPTGGDSTGSGSNGQQEKKSLTAARPRRIFTAFPSPDIHYGMRGGLRSHLKVG
jgi:hypothetical protein